MVKIVCLATLLLATSTAVFAIPAPEVDPTTGSSALALLIGGLVVMRARRKK